MKQLNTSLLVSILLLIVLVIVTVTMEKNTYNIIIMAAAFILGVVNLVRILRRR